MDNDHGQIKGGFYREYAKAKAEREQEQHYRDQYHVPESRPLIIETRQSTAVKMLGWLTFTLKRAGKLLLFLLFCILASLGLTALLNPPTREILVNIITNLFS